MKRRHALLSLFAALAILPATSARAQFWSASVTASGKVVSETRPVRGYTGIGLAVPGTVVIRQDATESVLIEADDNLMPEIETVVEDAILKIRFKRKLSISGRHTLRVLVSGPAFDTLAVAGSGDIVAEALKAGSLAVKIAGSGDVKIARLEAGTVKASISGSGDMSVAGKADEISATIAGSGDVVAERLEARRAKVSIAGSGDVRLWVRETLEVSIAGSGDVRYHGDPAVTKKIAGSGSLTRLGAAP